MKSDPALRLLIAGGCIVVIAGAGYYLLSEYRAHSQAQESETQRALNAALREACLDDLAVINKAFGASPMEKTKVANCLYMGSLTEAEVKEREELLGVSLR